MNTLIDSYVISLILVAIYMTVWFLVSVFKKRNDIADIAWGLGFILVAVSTFVFNTHSIGINLASLVTLCVLVWGIRLASYIFLGNRNKLEDYRYRAWREEWGKWFYLRSFFQVFLFQGLLLLLVISPIIFINSSTTKDIGLLSIIGLAVWLVAILFESIGDAQLARFIKNPANKGRLMTSGLWKYTRHPNYFGEVTGWWAIWLMALAVPFGAFSIIGPITITILILGISGIPMLERKMSEHPDFAEYKRKTSAFFPWFPKQ